jgi:hypothetical protein
MIITRITEETFKKPLYYSRWHSVGRKIDAEWVSYYDLSVGNMVGPILSADGSGSFLVGTYLTELIDLSQYEKKEHTDGITMWEIGEAGKMIFENTHNGIRYIGCFESFKDHGEDGLEPIGSYCIFTDSIEEAIVETWVRMLEFYPENKEYTNKDTVKKLDNIKEFINEWEWFVREYFPEKIIGVKV